MKNEVIGYLKKLHREECAMQSTICPGREQFEFGLHERNKMYLEWAIKKLSLNPELANQVEMNTQATGISDLVGREEFQSELKLEFRGMFKSQLEAEKCFKEMAERML